MSLIVVFLANGILLPSGVLGGVCFDGELAGLVRRREAHPLGGLECRLGLFSVEDGFDGVDESQLGVYGHL